MLLDLKRTSAPDGEPISLDEAKAHLRVDSASEDANIQVLIDAATARVDGYTGVLGRALMTQTWQLCMPRFGAHWAHHGRYPGNGVWLDHGRHHWRTIRLPLPPLQSVTQVAYVDIYGANQVLDPAQYAVIDGPLSKINLAPGACWPSTQCDNERAVTITFIAGYGDASAVPPPIKSAMLLLIGHMYANREAVVGVESRDSSTELPLGVSALLAPFRVITV